MDKNENNQKHRKGDYNATIGDAAGARCGDADEEVCEQPKECGEGATIAELDATRGARRNRHAKS